MKLFPTAQVIHAIRDGRDVTASSLDAYRGPRFFYTDPYYHARTWSDRVLCGRRAGRALPPDRYHEVRYEDLTADPQGRLRDLCRFLGESFHPSMASPSVEARRHHHSRGIHQLVRGPVTTARSGRWRADLLPQDQRLVQRVAAKALTDLGYPLFDLGHARPTEPVRQALFRGKYEVLSAGRQLLQASGISHPTWLIDFLPRRKKTPHPPPTSPARIASSEQS
jgi:hypothetical protein